MTTDLALQALVMAVWRRKPAGQVMVHSDQGSQFTSREWQTFLRQHNLEPSVSRRGNYHDNAVAESFFRLLKRERIRRRTYPTREAARHDVFEYIELFYNPKRKHTNNGTLSPVDFEVDAVPIVAPIRQRFGDLLWLFPADQAKASQAGLNVSVDGIVRRWDNQSLNTMMLHHLT